MQTTRNGPSRRTKVRPTSTSRTQVPRRPAHHAPFEIPRWCVFLFTFVIARSKATKQSRKQWDCRALATLGLAMTVVGYFFPFTTFTLIALLFASGALGIVIFNIPFSDLASTLPPRTATGKRTER